MFRTTPSPFTSVRFSNLLPSTRSFNLLLAFSQNAEEVDLTTVATRLLATAQKMKIFSNLETVEFREQGSERPLTALPKGDRHNFDTHIKGSKVFCDYISATAAAPLPEDAAAPSKA